MSSEAEQIFKALEAVGAEPTQIIVQFDFPLVHHSDKHLSLVRHKNGWALKNWGGDYWVRNDWSMEELATYKSDEILEQLQRARKAIFAEACFGMWWTAARKVAAIVHTSSIDAQIQVAVDNAEKDLPECYRTVEMIQSVCGVLHRHMSSPQSVENLDVVTPTLIAMVFHMWSRADIPPSNELRQLVNQWGKICATPVDQMIWARGVKCLRGEDG